jgi:excisionase family DNA binding protein
MQNQDSKIQGRSAPERCRAPSGQSLSDDELTRATGTGMSRDNGGTCNPSLDAVAADPAMVATLTQPVRASLLARCAAVLATLSGVILDEATPRQPALPPEPDPLIILPEAARSMGFAASYVYEMARRGDFPVVRHGRYVRARRSTIEHWIAEHEHHGVDKQVNIVLTSPRDARRSATATTAARAHTGGTRQTTRRARDHSLSLGDGRGAHLRADRATAGTVREDNSEGNA